MFMSQADIGGRDDTVNCPNLLINTVCTLTNGKYTVISCLFEKQSKLLIRGSGEDPGNLCPRPSAEDNSFPGLFHYQGISNSQKLAYNPNPLILTMNSSKVLFSS
jgi:hypothetical protein